MFIDLCDEGGEVFVSIQTFYVPQTQVDTGLVPVSERGWYWWPRRRDGKPEGMPVGPFPSEMEAIENARSP